MKKHLLLACVIGTFTLPAAAEGIYLLGDIGQSKTEYSSDGLSINDEDTTFTLGGGYNFNDTFALEVAYRDLGSMNYHEEDNDYDFVAIEDFTALQVSLVAKFPVSDAVDVFGRLGLGSIKSDYKETYTDFEFDYQERASESDTKTKTVFGIGASYAIDQTCSLRVEYNKFADYEDTSISTLTVGVKYNF